MKTFKVLFLSTIMISVFSMGSFAQGKVKKNISEVSIKTTAQCEMCKERMEKALAYEPGVVMSDLNVETKIITVRYKTKKTNADKIRLVISKTGYDADGIPADEKAYHALPTCCKLGGHDHQ